MLCGFEVVVVFVLFRAFLDFQRTFRRCLVLFAFVFGLF